MEELVASLCGRKSSTSLQSLVGSLPARLLHIHCPAARRSCLISVIQRMLRETEL